MVGELGDHNGLQSLFEKVRISNFDFQIILIFETFNILQNETRVMRSKAFMKFEVRSFEFPLSKKYEFLRISIFVMMKLRIFLENIVKYVFITF